LAKKALSDISMIMKIRMQRWKYYERTKPFYGCRETIARRKEGISDDRGQLQSPTAATETSITLGRDRRDNGKALACSRKERRWQTWAEVGCEAICCDNSLNNSEAISEQRNGRLFSRECGSQNLHLKGVADNSTNTRSLQH